MSIIYTAIDSKTAKANRDKSKDCPTVVSISETVSINNQNYKVTVIAASAFYNCKGITSITLPKTIERIENNAFDITGITFFPTLPDSLTFIGNWAFASCGFTSIVLPKNLQHIGEGAFSFNTNLNTITISPSNTYLRTDEKNVLYDSKMTKIYIVPPYITHYVIPPTVTYLNSGAFVQSNIKEIIIPSSVININYQCFCSSKLEIVYLEGNHIFDQKAFQSISNLTKVFYYGTRKVTVSLFQNSKIPEITTCSGYKIDTFGGLDSTRSSDCTVVPMAINTCKCSNKVYSLESTFIAFLLTC